MYSVSGRVKRPGVYEAPVSVTLRQLIYEHAGGVSGNGILKAVVPGGGSAAILTADEIDVTMDVDGLKNAGTMIGSAGVIVMDETVSIPEALMVVARFYAHESCGQCTPCRESTGWIYKMGHRIVEGQGAQGRPRHDPRRRQARRRHDHLRLLRRRRRPLHLLHRKVPERVRGAMPKLTIDGKEIEVPAGTNLIEAAKRLGIEVPHYCYHPALSIAGQCRLCMVDIEKTPRPTIACNTQAADGMVVHTETERVKETRRSMMEFHLINHPLDCPVCDQAGECWLQIYYMKHGLYDPRMTDEKVHKPKAVPLGPHVMLDAERCILCSRCVRFCDEITGTGELGIFHRGDHSEIGLFPGHDLENKYSGNVVDICPVGALTDRDFRFQVRVWYLDTTKSVCPGCARGCNIDVHVNRRRPHHADGRRVARLKPRFNAAVNRVVDLRRRPLRLRLRRRREPRAHAAAERGGPGGAGDVGRGGRGRRARARRLSSRRDRRARVPAHVQRGPLGGRRLGERVRHHAARLPRRAADGRRGRGHAADRADRRTPTAPAPSSSVSAATPRRCSPTLAPVACAASGSSTTTSRASGRPRKGRSGAWRR